MRARDWAATNEFSWRQFAAMGRHGDSGRWARRLEVLCGGAGPQNKRLARARWFQTQTSFARLIKAPSSPKVRERDS